MKRNVEVNKDDYLETASLWCRFCVAYRGWLPVSLQVGELHIPVRATAPLGGIPGDRSSVHLFQGDIQYTVLDLYNGGYCADRDRVSRVTFP